MFAACRTQNHYELQEPPPGKPRAANRRPPTKPPVQKQSGKPSLKGGSGLSPAALDLFGNTDPYSVGF